MTKSVETRDLKVGDVMAFTGDTVVSSPSCGLKTPRGKVEFTVKTKNGHLVSKSWNRHTLINILKADEPVIVPSIRITYKDFTITEQSGFGSRWVATYPGGAEVKLRGDEDLEEVKEVIDWLSVEMDCETADISDGFYYGKHWNEDKI